MNQIQRCWRRLKIQPKKEHDLQSREARKTIGGKALSDVEVIGRKDANVTKKEKKRRIVRSRAIFERPPKMKLLFLLVCVKFSGNDNDCSFRFAVAIETLCRMAQCMPETQKHQINRQYLLESSPRLYKISKQ